MSDEYSHTGVTSADQGDKLTQVLTPDGVTWERVSPQLVPARMTLAGLIAGVALICGAILMFIPTVPKVFAYAVFGLTAVGLVWAWWFVRRRAASWGYAERAEDLLVVRGILFRRLVVVPYGRMQLVDLAAGPIDRLFGIVSLQLHTAAATSDAKIPGLRPEVAADLRDRLATLGEERAAGL